MASGGAAYRWATIEPWRARCRKAISDHFGLAFSWRIALGKALAIAGDGEAKSELRGALPLWRMDILASALSWLGRGGGMA
jgi:hypothetical protein